MDWVTVALTYSSIFGIQFFGYKKELLLYSINRNISVLVWPLLISSAVDF